MSETPQHSPAGAAAAYRYSAADLAHFAGAEELAAGAAVVGEGVGACGRVCWPTRWPPDIAS